MMDMMENPEADEGGLDADDPEVDDEDVDWTS